MSVTFVVRTAILLASVIVPEATSAQPILAGSIAGVIKDETGAVVPGATVVIEASTSAFARVVVTGRDGRFRATGLESGAYRVTVVAPGFAARSQQAVVPASTDLDVILQPAPVVEDVRVVSATRQEVLRQSLNTRVDVISRPRIETTGAETVGEVLLDLPGVLTRRGSETAGQAGQQVQGIDSRQVLVLLDGQPIPSARGIKRGIVNLDRQSTARLDRVEVVKGASSALYGSDAIGGVINLITRDVSAPLDLGATVSGGTFGDLNIHSEAGVRRGGWSALFVAERHQSDGFDLTPTTFDTTGAPFRRADVLAKVSTRVAPALSFSALATGYTNHTTGRSNGELGPQEDDIHDDTLSAGLTAEWLARPSLTLQGRAYLSRYNERSTARLAPRPAQRSSLVRSTKMSRRRISHSRRSSVHGNTFRLEPSSGPTSMQGTTASRSRAGCRTRLSSAGLNIA